MAAYKVDNLVGQFLFNWKAQRSIDASHDFATIDHTGKLIFTDLLLHEIGIKGFVSGKGLYLLIALLVFEAIKRIIHVIC